MRRRKLWLELLVPCAVLLLLAVDFYFAFDEGKTFRFRLGGFVYFSETPTIFIATVVAKLVALGACLWLLRGTLTYHREE